MKVFANTAFLGCYPVGTAAVVVAEDQGAAAELLKEALAKVGLSQAIDPAEMFEIVTDSPIAHILNDGNY